VPRDKQSKTSIGTKTGIGASLRAVRPLALMLQSSGVDAAAWLTAAGITPQALFDDEARIAFGGFAPLWERAAALLPDDEGMGVRALELASLRFGTVTGVGSAYLLLDLFAAGPSVGDALTRLGRYWAIGFGDESAVVVRRSTKALTLELQPASLPFALADYVIAMMTALLRVHAPSSTHVPLVTLGRARPADASTHLRFFGPSVQFGARSNTWTLPEAALATPLVGAQPSLVPLLERRADEVLTRLRGVPSVVSQVQALLAQELPSGNPAADHIASKLGMSVRTMSRKLLGAGTTHKQLVDRVRAELAERYLLEDERSATEVALLLGFAELSAFDRAFKRWHGVSPTQFRAVRRGPASAGS